MSKKKGLGLGLSALITSSDSNVNNHRKNDFNVQKIDDNLDDNLIGDKTGDVNVSDYSNLKYLQKITDHLKTIPINLIKRNEEQPRKNFDEESLEDLSQSIKRYGIIQPILVKQSDEKDGKIYEIIAGERRFRAAEIAGLDEVPVIIRSSNHEDDALIAIVENVQREDLNPIEEALAYRQIMDHRLMTQLQLSEELGKSRAYIANIVRLLQLDDESIKAINEGLLTSSQGRALLGEPNLKKRAKMRDLLINKQINVNALEKKISKKKAEQTKREIDPYISDIENSLSEIFGTKVNLTKKRKGWNVSVFCYSDQDLQNLCDMLKHGKLDKNE